MRVWLWARHQYILIGSRTATATAASAVATHSGHSDASTTCVAQRQLLAAATAVASVASPCVCGCPVSHVPCVVARLASSPQCRACGRIFWCVVPCVCCGLHARPLTHPRCPVVAHSYACSSKEFDMATVVVGAARGASTDPRRPRRVCDTCFNVLSIFVRSVIDDKRKRKARARRAKSRPNRRSAGASAPPPAAALSERSSSRGRVVPAKSINGPAGNTPRAAR